MIPVPQYLKQYAYEETKKKDSLSFKIRCTCGCKTFNVFESFNTDEETRAILEYEKKLLIYGATLKLKKLYSEIDSTGNTRQYIKKFFFFRKYIEEPEKPTFMYLEVRKLSCIQCGKEFVLFDNRYHGYDGMTSMNEEARKYVPQFRPQGKTPLEIEVIVENEPTLEEFIEASGEECSYEFYSDSFISIDIFGTDKDGKRTMLLGFETA